MDNGNDDFCKIAVRTITVRTCVGTYDKLRKIKPNLYRDAPSEGIDITVKYYDTFPESYYLSFGGTEDNPLEIVKTIVAIHGLPGNYTNFDPIPQYFAMKKNVRVIVPNMPDFSHTRKTGVFWHSTEEKCQFLKDFLKKLNVKRINCLIAHSFGMQTASQFWDQCTDIQIDSFALFAPQPMVDVGLFVNLFVDLLIFPFRSNWWYNLLGYLRVYRSILIPMRLQSIDQFLQICTAAYETESPAKIYERIDKLATNSDRPIILLFGSRERLIRKSSIRSLQKHLQIDDHEVIYLDPNRDLPESTVRMDRRIMYYHVKGGGHFAHANYHQFTTRMIENLLDYKC